jgi:hypothetical protein
MGLRGRDGHGHRVKVEGHATVLLVEDVRRSTDYHRDKLGFEVKRYASLRDHNGYARRGDCDVHFARFDGAYPRPTSMVVPPDLFDAYACVDEVHALYVELVERGAEVVHGPID